MSVEVRVNNLGGESISEATVAKIEVSVGSEVKENDIICILETEKVAVEVLSPCSGRIKEIKVKPGDVIVPKALIAMIEQGEISLAKVNGSQDSSWKQSDSDTSNIISSGPFHSPAGLKLMKESNLSPDQVKGTGKDSRIMREDVLNHLSNQGSGVGATITPANPAQKPEPSAMSSNLNSQFFSKSNEKERAESSTPMSRIRQKTAERLKFSQNVAATLTTFNEVDMHRVMELRGYYKDSFEKKYGVKLGFMSFFIKAATIALQAIPEINSEIRGNNIIHKNYCDVGVAVGTEQGLVVPVIRNAEKMSLAELESTLVDLGKRAHAKKLSVDEMVGGTFTISNGGVYGSLLSTPILNPPQSGILGMHNIQKRPVVINDKIEIRPMMYLALSYDHRIVDGKGAVTFLIKIKELIEDPTRMILEI